MCTPRWACLAQAWLSNQRKPLQVNLSGTKMFHLRQHFNTPTLSCFGTIFDPVTLLPVCSRHFGLKRFGIWQGIFALRRTDCPHPLPSAWAQWSTSPSSLHHLAVLQCVPENRIWWCLSVGNLQNFLILQWNSIPPWSTSKLPPIPELLPLAQ